MFNISFPILRPRRLRRNPHIRNAVGESSLEPRNLIMPLFVKEGIDVKEHINAMPNQFRYPVKRLNDIVSILIDSGIHSIILFGIPKHKDEVGSEAYNKNGIVQQAVREVKKNFGEEMIVFTDVCMCQYTVHGHCGIISERRGKFIVDNDETLKYIGKIAVSHAEAGADFVAPSGMMDGMVKTIRSALDNEGFNDVGIMSYSAKYASSFYGPFREAAYSSPQFGDRKSYQMDPRNLREAIREVLLDINEGADILMVKPALPYLDVIRTIKNILPYPLAAYSVSGEYSMVKAAADRGWINEENIVLEMLISMKRAGADLIITYYALDAAKWIEEKHNLF